MTEALQSSAGPPPRPSPSERNIFKMRASRKDRSVYSFLERFLPAATFLFASLILLQDHDRSLLIVLILGHIAFNVAVSKAISHKPRRSVRGLEGSKNVANAAYVAACILWIGPSSFFWILHYLAIARSMLAFRSSWTRMGMVTFLAATAAAAEAVASNDPKAAVEPMVLLITPTLLTEVLFRFFDQKLLQEKNDRLRAEHALRLSGRMEAVGSLASGIAHEINTPVQYVSDSLVFVREGVADLLRLHEQYSRLGELALAGEAKALEAQGRIVRQAERSSDADYLVERVPGALDRMAEGLERVSEIVDSVRRISHPGTSSKTPEDLNEAIRATVRVTTSAWKDVAEVKLELGELPPVDCNLGELHQVFLNLLINSADAIRERGSGKTDGSITLSTECHGPEVEVSIADNGCGIPAEHLERVFDPFFTTKEIGSGTGQGLAIAQTVVCDHHGGELQIESRPDGGTKVRIHLPIQQPGGRGGG